MVSIRYLPPVWKKLVQCEWFRRFTWKERLQIFFGYRVRLTMKMATEHSPGRYQADLTLVTCKDIDPKDIRKIE